MNVRKCYYLHNRMSINIFIRFSQSKRPGLAIPATWRWAEAPRRKRGAESPRRSAEWRKGLRVGSLGNGPPRKRKMLLLSSWRREKGRWKRMRTLLWRTKGRRHCQVDGEIGMLLREKFQRRFKWWWSCGGRTTRLSTTTGHFLAIFRMSTSCRWN